MPFDPKDIVYLDEMLDASRRLEEHLKRTSGEDFEADEVVFDAVCMCLIRIGEGARLLSDAAKAELPDMPWPDIINLRHRIAHGYSHLRGSVLWVTATRSVPPFAQALAMLRGRMDELD